MGMQCISGVVDVTGELPPQENSPFYGVFYPQQDRMSQTNNVTLPELNTRDML